MSLSQKMMQSQSRAFQKWVNYRLAPTGKQCADMTHDWRDGTLLVTLLKVISDRRVGGKKYRFRVKKKPDKMFECMDNIQVSLNYLEAKGLKLVNIGAGDIYHGNMKITLGLIWTLIQTYQIDAKEGISEEAGAADIDAVAGAPELEAASTAGVSSGAKRLLQWCQGVVAPYVESGFGERPRNFAGSFSDGRSFAALIHAHFPDMLDLTQVGADPRANLELVMDVAARNLGIPRMLDPEDIDMLLTNPNSVSKVVQLYVAMLKEQLTALKEAELAKAQQAAIAAEGHDLLQGALDGGTSVTAQVAVPDDAPPPYVDSEEEQDNEEGHDDEEYDDSSAGGGVPAGAGGGAPAGNSTTSNTTSNTTYNQYVNQYYQQPPPNDYSEESDDEDLLRVKGRVLARAAAMPGRARVEGRAVARARPLPPAPRQDEVPARATAHGAATLTDAVFMEVLVPPGCVPGQMVDIPAPDGTKRRIAIPTGYFSGQTFRFNFRDAPLTPGTARAPVRPQPQPVRVQPPTQAYVQPAQAYGQPAQAYGQPVQGYARPLATTTAALPMAYAAPVQQTMYRQPTSTTTIYTVKAKKGRKNRGYRAYGY